MSKSKPQPYEEHTWLKRRVRAVEGLANEYLDANRRAYEHMMEGVRLKRQRTELLAALKWLTNVACGVGKAGGTPESGEFEDAVKQAQAVIARAEGTEA